jgi:hypothetical protein
MKVTKQASMPVKFLCVNGELEDGTLLRKIWSCGSNLN